MAENFQENVSYGGSTLAVSGDAIAVGSTNAGAKSVIFNNSGSQGHLVWQPSANHTINLPDVGGTLQLTGQVPGAIYDGANSISSGTIRFTNANGVSFLINGQTISGSVAVQTNQTVGLYALGNTTQNSSTTLDARTLSFNGLGIITAGYSNGSIQISATQSNQTANIVVPSAGTQTATSGTVVFSNSNGISFGMSNSSVITASYTVPTQTAQTIGLYGLGNTTQNSSTTLDARTLSFNGLGGNTVGYSNGSIQISGVTTAGLISGINVSAGTTSNNLSAITFSNSNGLSFGLNGSTITGSYTVPTQTAQTVGLYALGNTTQNSSTTLDARTLSFNGLGAATVGYSNGSIQISVPTQTAQTQSLIQAIYDGANSITTGTIRFTNANGVSFSINGQTISGSVAAQTVQTIGLYALGNTTQNSSTTLDARTLSFNGLGAATVGYSNGSIQISVPNALTNINISAGTTSNNLTALTFSNVNGVSFGLNASTITASVAAQTNQTVGLYALGNTTQNSSTTLDARTLSFNGLGIITAGYSNGSIQISATTAAQTVQTVGLYALGNTTQNSSTTLDARTLSFNGLGAATVGYSNGSIQISAPVQTVQTQSLIQAIYDGVNSISTGTIRFTNANGVSFSINGQTISASIAAQTNQTEGMYAIGNTVGQSSSSTFDARTMSISGAGIASVGYSGNALIISVPSGAAQINVSAGTTSNNLGAITFSNSNNVSFGLNGSTITASIPNQTIGLYALGNTTQNSSTTLDARTLSFNGLGGATVGYSNGSIQISGVTTAGLISGINISAGTTSNNLTAFVFSNSNSVSFGLSGSTITASIPNQNYTFSNSNNISFGIAGSVITASASRIQISQLLWPDVPWQTNFPISNASFSLQHFNAGADILASQANLLMALSGNTNSSGALTISLGIYINNGSTLSLMSSDSRNLTWTSGSQTSASSLFGGISGTRYRTVSLANWSISAGDYVLGMHFRTTNNGTWNAFGQQGPTIVGAVDVNETQAYLHGFSTSSYTTAMVASLNVTDTNYVRTGGNANQQPGIILLGSF